MSTPDAGLSRQAFRLYQSGYYAQAEPLFERLAGEDPTNWQYPLVLGLCRYRSICTASIPSREHAAKALGFIDELVEHASRWQSTVGLEGGFFPLCSQGRPCNGNRYCLS